MAKRSATATAPRRAAAVVPVDATTAAVTPIFGIALTINQKPVTITGSALDPSNGFDFRLPGRLDLGKLTDLAAALAPFGINFPDVSTFPPPLDTIAKAVMGTDFAVEQLRVNVPGKTATDQNTHFRVEMSATLATPATLGPIAINGVTFGGTNEAAPATEAVALP